VGENVLPAYYANPGTGHPAIPPDSCNPAGAEDFAGIANGLDNDGDGIYGLADTDCQLLSVTPSPLDFGDVLTGTSSAPRTVTITNNFRAGISVSDISITGVDAAQFSLSLGDGTGGTCGTLPVALAAGADCTVSVTFSPTAAAARSASLDIASDGGDKSLALSGTGIAPGTPGISLSPTSKDFGSVTTSTSSSPQAVTIGSTGTVDLVVNGIGLTGTDAAEFSFDVGDGTGGTCGSTAPVIASGANCTVSVTFSPLSTGAKTASLDIASDGGDKSLALSGTGQSAAGINNAPSAPALVTPKNGATISGTSVAFGWDLSTDPDGDTVTYDLYVCEGDDTFSAPCGSPENITPIQSASAESRGIHYAKTGLWALLAGIALAGGFNRRKMLAFLFALLLVSGMLIAACGGGGGGGVTPAPAQTGDITFETLGLTGSATYYWKVIATDGTDSTPSAVWSFTTQ
jgi:hypothetical protein